MSRPPRVVLGAGAVWLGILVTHIAAFGVLGVALGMPFGGFNSPPDFFTAAAMGTSAAVGRLAVWKLARQYDDGRPTAYAPDVP